MKYIRTQKGKIMKIDLSNKDDQSFYYHYKNNPFLDDFEKGNLIIKEADNVEKLCDGFIITSKQGHIYDSYGDYNYELREVLPQAREECPDEEWDFYGCILVDGIITQVAKAKGFLPNGEIDWELL